MGGENWIFRERVLHSKNYKLWNLKGNEDVWKIKVSLRLNGSGNPDAVFVRMRR